MTCDKCEESTGAGFILGALLSGIVFFPVGMAFIQLQHDLADKGIKAECEKELPRNQSCKLIAVIKENE